MVGLEALAMQGLPIDQLLLTKETQKHLQDLAGNAMSTTVVGAAMLSALVVGMKLLNGPEDSADYSMEVDEVTESEPISDLGDLVERPLDLAVTTDVLLKDLLAAAQRSTRLCSCEGRKDVTARNINKCLDCGATCCISCGGKPEHNPRKLDFTQSPRVHPSKFVNELKALLPMCLVFTQVKQGLLKEFALQAGIAVECNRWNAWVNATVRATSLELRFIESKRNDIWSVVYESRYALLELSLHPQQPEWHLFAKPESSIPANSDVRVMLNMAVARMRCDEGLLTGSWEFALPLISEFPVKMQAKGNLVPSWEQKLGLVGSGFIHRNVYDQIGISVPEEHASKLDRDISGVYNLLDRCGTANAALHKQGSNRPGADLPTLYMFLDPSRCGPEKDDNFVISISHRRYEFAETRPIVCRLLRWRQSSDSVAKVVSCQVLCKWQFLPSVTLTVSLAILP